MKTRPQNTLNKISFFKSQGYPARFRSDVHKLLLFGYKAVKHELNCNSEETLITIRIAKEIWAGLNTYGLLPDSILRKRYFVFPEIPDIAERDPNNVKDKYVRFDIQVFDSRHIPYRAYCIEAKRLKKNGFPISEYCGEGIVRFINDSYCKDAPEAAMIGFWQDADENYWSNELSRKFDEDKDRDVLGIVEGLTSCTILPEFEHEFVSLHRRTSKSQILMFHIFLDCM